MDFRPEKNEPLEHGSDRAFGITFAVVFGLIAAFKLWHGSSWGLAWAGLSVGFLLAALLKAHILHPLNRQWARFGMVLHCITSPIILGLLFFVAILPIGLLMRALGKDMLRLKYDPKAQSYWIERNPPGPPPETMINQF